MKSLLLYVLYSVTTPTPEITLPYVPPGTVVNINATVCVNKADMQLLVDTVVKGGDAQKVFTSLDGCNSYCISATIVREARRFYMQNNQLYAVFEVLNYASGPQTIWAATAIEANGLPIGQDKNYYAKKCVPEAEKLK